MKDPYFSIHGNDTEGWRVMIYEYVPNPAAPDLGSEDNDKLTARPGWGSPKQFKTFAKLSSFIKKFPDNG